MSRFCCYLFGCLLISACATQQSYEGPKRERDELARISGDMRITAGAPISVILRKVDEYQLNLSQNSVDVLPGSHELLVDCKIAETGSVVRFSIDVEVYEGESYRLVAETGPGLRDCTAVHLETID